MQKYKCHKIVEAMEVIHWIIHSDGSATLKGSGMQEQLVGRIWMEKNKPGVGGYFVRYEDNYSSWSPAKAFEDGYCLLAEAEAKVEGEANIASMSASLLHLLDRIETENDPGLATERFAIAEAAGMNVVFGEEASMESH